MRKQGMGYSDVVGRIRRIQANPGHPEAKANLIKSLKNQCRLAEGEKAIIEMNKELVSNISCSRALSGAGHKQTGVCMKFDCVVRGVDCDRCYKGSAYNPRNAAKGSALSLNAVKEANNG